MGMKFSTEEPRGSLGDVASGWTVTEYATPEVVNESSGGINVASVSGKLRDDTIFLTDKTVTLQHYSEDDANISLGKLRGDVQSVRISGATASVSVNSIMAKLSVDRTAEVVAPGRLFGQQVSAVSSRGDFNGYYVFAMQVTRSGLYVYVISGPDENNPNLLSKISLADGKLVWKLTTIGNMRNNTMAVLDDDSVAYYGRLNTIQRFSASGVALASIAVPAVPNLGFGGTINTTTLSVDELGNIVLGRSSYAIASATANDYQSYYRVIKYSPSGAVIMDTTDKIITRNTATPDNAIYQRPQRLFAISGERMVIYGPVTAAQSRYQQWAVYNVSAAGLTFIKNMNVSQTANDYSTAVVSRQDASGSFVVGASLMDSSAEPLASWEAVRASLSAPLDNPQTPALFMMAGMTANGRVVYGSYNFQYPLVRPYIIDRIQFDGLQSNPLLSDAFSYYFGLVFRSGIEGYKVDYKSTINPPVVLRGWKGNAWDYICQLCVAYGVEIVFVNEVPTVRDLGSTSLDISELAISPSFSPTVVGNSKSVSVAYQRASLVSQDSKPGFFYYNLFLNPTAKTNTTYMLGQYAVVERQNGYVKAGQTSFQVRPDGGSASSHAFYGYERNIFSGGIPNTGVPRAGMSANSPYTIRATLHLPSAQKGRVDRVNARRIIVSASNSVTGQQKKWMSDQAPDAAGNYDIVMPFSFGSEFDRVGIYFMNGSDTTLANWYNIRISLKALAGNNVRESDFYDGDSPGWRWSSTSGLSISTLEIPATDPDNVLYDARKDDNRVFSVAARNREEYEVTMDAYPISFAQPLVADSLNALPGSYFVSAADNLPVRALQWQDYGGQVIVSKGTEPNQLKVLLIGPVMDIPGTPGPYKLSASDGNTDFAFFSVIGSGVRVNPSSVTVSTGVDTSKITREDSGTVDNFAINTQEQAYDAAYGLADIVGSPSVELTLDIPTARISGLGLTPGAVVTYMGANYRVLSSVIKNLTTSLTLKRYTLVSDVINYYGDITVEAVTASWDGYTGEDFTLMPFKTVTGAS